MFDGSRVLHLEPRSAFLPVPPPLAVVVFEHPAVQVLHPLPRFLRHAGIAVTARLVLGRDGMGWGGVRLGATGCTGVGRQSAGRRDGCSLAFCWVACRLASATATSSQTRPQMPARARPVSALPLPPRTPPAVNSAVISRQGGCWEVNKGTSSAWCSRSQR